MTGRSPVMDADSARDLCRAFDLAGVRCWVVGGWGVDALLGRRTRPHKDLDVLLAFTEHADAWRLLHERGYRLIYRWEENVDVPGAFFDETGQPTAYVLQDTAGRLVDVHVLDDRPHDPTALWTTDRVFIPGALDAIGTIDGLTVRCMSARMQLVAHADYELPIEHQADVYLLEQLL